jgi:AraC-like DNA-binding protein
MTPSALSAEFVDMQVHRDRVPEPATHARVVLSRLPRGATPLPGGALSLKFVLDGEERYSIDGRTYRLESGQLLIVDARRPGEVTLPGAATGLCLYLPQLAHMAPGTAELILDGPVTLAAARHPLGAFLGAAARRLAREPEAGGELADRIARRAMTRLSQLIANHDPRLGRLDAIRPATRRELLRRVEIARAWLHAHPDRPVPLGEVAAQAGTSPFHLARAFAAVYGEPPATYHRNLRLDAVARELRRGTVTPAEAAHRLGFADQAGFTRAFKRRHGVTPGALARSVS